MSLVDFFGLDEPSEFHLLRNHLQRITHPHLTVKGHGDYYIEYIYKNKQIFEYFKYMSLYKKNLEEMKNDPLVNILHHGLLPYKAWEKWDIKKL